MKKLITIITLLTFAGMLRAQNDGFQLEAPGSVSPLTKETVRKESDIAKTKDTTLPPPQFTYTLQTKRYLTEVKIDTIRPAKLGNEPVQKLYRTYARLGVGNYSSLLGEFSVSSLRSKTGAWGAYIRHFSAGGGPKDVAGEFSGFNQQEVNVYGKRFLKKHVLYGSLDYDRDAVFNYGSVSPLSSFEKGATRQYFNYFSPAMRLQSHLTDSTAINHDIGLRYYHLADRYEVKEDNIRLDAALGRYIRTEHLTVDFGVDYNHNAGASDSASNTIVKLQPVFSASGNKFQAAIGIGMVYESADAGAMYFYPQASFSYDVINHILVPYVTLGGYLERNSYRSLTLENPFLLSTEAFRLQNTQHKYELAAGLRGSITKDIAYDVHVSRVDLVHAPFFVNTTSAQDIFQNKFTVVYDNASVVNVHGQMEWQQFEKLRLIASGDWYKYSMENEAHPWHTPTLRLSLVGEYNLRDKILARTQLYYLNGQYAKIASGDGFQSVTLKGLVDVNIGLEYRYTKFLSLFLNINNIASQRYERWYAYPTQKLNVLGGLTYTF